MMLRTSVCDPPILVLQLVRHRRVSLSTAAGPSICTSSFPCGSRERYDDREGSLPRILRALFLRGDVRFYGVTGACSHRLRANWERKAGVRHREKKG